jgi:D-alanyl-lipoteichoic acid acyltransferase DltB (MBOAT superfamily)
VLFNSLEYLLLFLPSVVVVYFLLNRYQLSTIAKLWLVFASFVFYCRHIPVFGILLLVSILFNFGMGRLIHRQQKYSGILLLVAVSTNLTTLGYFKYANFFVNNLVALTGWQLTLGKIVLPLGISFFTFTQIAYLVDVYRRVAHEYNILHYFLFVTYFPHLVAGPILHHKEMMPQFADSKNNVMDWDNIFKGLFVFAIGLFKKVIIADQFALWANAGFGSVHDLLFHEAWIASLSYTLQIYFDFSGYTDMAIGASLMLNIRLPLNFNSPYQAVNIQDFWRRWHMTLSRWLRDYVYIPLGGNQKGKTRTYLNLGITFLLGGLWHGANWTFVVWGALHGAATAVHKGWAEQGINMPRWLAVMITFLFVNFAWVFFAANNFAEALQVLKGMAGLHGGAALSFNADMYTSAYSGAIAGDRQAIAQAVEKLGNTSAFYSTGIIWIVLWGSIVLFGRNSMELIERYSQRPLLPLVWMGLAFSIPLFVLTFMSSRINEFIYFNF